MIQRGIHIRGHLFIGKISFRAIRFSMAPAVEGDYLVVGCKFRNQIGTTPNGTAIAMQQHEWLALAIDFVVHFYAIVIVKTSCFWIIAITRRSRLLCMQRAEGKARD